MKKSRIVIVLLFLAVVSISVFKASIAPFLAKLQANRLNESRKNERSRSFSSLQPYTYIRIDSMPRKPWVRTDFRFGWLSPEALSNTALNYSFVPQLYGFDGDDWKQQVDLDPDLPGITGVDSSFLVAGNKFAPYPYSLIASIADNSAGPMFPGGSGSSPVSGGGPVPDRRSGSVAENNVTSIPEPATSGLLAILCAILAVSGYRRVAKPAPQLE